MASGSVNRVILVGNLGKDPEIKYTQNGIAMANLTIATTESWKDKQTGENQKKTEWHRVVFYQRLAEIAGEYLHKGSKIYLEGRLQTRKWQDKTTGQDRYSTEIVGESLQMLDNRGQYNNNMAVETEKQNEKFTFDVPNQVNLNEDIPF